MFRRGVWLFAAWVAMFAAVASGQNLSGRDTNPRHIDGSTFGQRIDLGTNWLFAPTDSPAYADPGFDDREWKVVSTRRDLSSYGIHDLAYGWYRLHVQAPPTARSMVLTVEGTDGRYQAFVNGQQIAGPATLDRHIRWGQLGVKAYAVPDDLIAASGGKLTVAFRFEFDTGDLSGKGASTPMHYNARVYLTSAESAPREIGYAYAQHTTLDNGLAFLTFVAGWIALSLFLAMRTQKEYLAIACYLFACEGVWLPHNLGDTYTLATGILVYTFYTLRYICIIEFVRLMLRMPRTRFLLALEAATLCCFTSVLAIMGIDPAHVGFVLFYVPVLTVCVVLPVLLFRGWRRGNHDAGVLLPALLVLSLYSYWNFLHFALYDLHIVSTLGALPSFHVGDHVITVRLIGDAVFTLTILLFLVLRTVWIARDRARVAGEMEAARTMQQMLLAQSSASTPGFTVESVYLPASEVGGDFFLVSPAEDGSVTAIVGDVSGKGLQAAMRVSMILGVLRREDSRKPGEILAALNRALLAQSEFGFTTACCVHLERSGRFVFANAGHVSPYVVSGTDSVELESPPSLPLGLADDQQYEESMGTLPAGGRLVLTSDGVVEARAADGELYGFERMGALMLLPAAEIAAWAQEFGQEDDITVLTIACAV